MRSAWHALVAVILGGGACLGLLACVSEHQAVAPAEGTCNFSLSEDVPGSRIVVIQDFAFSPAEVRIAPGERVTWINCGASTHTSTADGGAWASDGLAPGDVFTRVFDAAGALPYHCEPHPFMTGTVIVE